MVIKVNPQPKNKLMLKIIPNQYSNVRENKQLIYK